MTKRSLYIVSLLICFLIGAYIWKVIHTGRHASRDNSSLDTVSNFPLQSTLVYVGNAAITSADLEWEFNLHTAGAISNDDLTPIPKRGKEQFDYLSPLKQMLIASMIERKLLYKFIKNDSKFNLSDSSRYISCLKEWQETLAEPNPELIWDNAAKERLKNRLCEKAILEQYLKEQIFSQISIDEQETLRYYELHRSEFHTPKKVQIRQIVLASESAAKKVRARVNRKNFSGYARRLSITPEARNGGLLSPFAKGELPRFFDVAFTMRRGEIRSILKSTYGFHIIKLEKKFPEVKLDLTQARPRIKKILTKFKQEEEYQKWVELALNAVPIKIPKPAW